MFFAHSAFSHPPHCCTLGHLGCPSADLWVPCCTSTCTTFCSAMVILVIRYLVFFTQGQSGILQKTTCCGCQALAVRTGIIIVVPPGCQRNSWGLWHHRFKFQQERSYMRHQLYDSRYCHSQCSDSLGPPVIIIMMGMKLTLTIPSRVLAQLKNLLFIGVILILLPSYQKALDLLPVHCGKTSRDCKFNVAFYTMKSSWV